MLMKWAYRISAISLGAVAVTTFLYGMWLLCRAFLFDQFIIPTDSMRPTLIPGDRVIVDKTIMGARIYSDFNFNPDGGELKCWRTKGRRAIRHNDIVVFNFPHHDGHINFIYCKRCVALPGDTLWSENGFYKDNCFKGILGVEEEQKRFGAIPDTLLAREVLNVYPFDWADSCTTKNLPHLYIPRRGDVMAVTPEVASYYKMILEWELGKSITYDDSTRAVLADGEELRRHIFKHNYYFMAGDNVLDSNDSRYWGLVPEEYIVGVVTRISYSKNRQTDKLRHDRIWRKLTAQ